MCNLHTVNPLVLILSLLLSFLPGRREGNVSEISPNQARNREICITAAQGYTFAGDESGNSVSVRVPRCGQRISQQTRSCSRIVKSGKVIDNNHLHPFLAQPVLQLGGTHVSGRYLFSLCTLRL